MSECMLLCVTNRFSKPGYSNISKLVYLHYDFIDQSYHLHQNKLCNKYFKSNSHLPCFIYQAVPIYLPTCMTVKTNHDKTHWNRNSQLTFHTYTFYVIFKIHAYLPKIYHWSKPNCKRKCMQLWYSWWSIPKQN